MTNGLNLSATTIPNCSKMNGWTSCGSNLNENCSNGWMIPSCLNLSVTKNYESCSNGTSLNANLKLNCCCSNGSNSNDCLKLSYCCSNDLSLNGYYSPSCWNCCGSNCYVTNLNASLIAEYPNCWMNCGWTILNSTNSNENLSYEKNCCDCCWNVTNLPNYYYYFASWKPNWKNSNGSMKPNYCYSNANC